MDKQKHTAAFEAPDLAPVIVTEHTRAGWRGLTEDGEIYNVNAHVNGEPAYIPESLGITLRDQTIGYRKVEQKTSEGVIDKYLHHLNESTKLTRLNDHDGALTEIGTAMSYAPTRLARYNRSMILLSLGYFSQGFDDFARCERECELFMRPQFKAAIDKGLVPWRGQPLAGKVLLLLHDHGFGDTIMCLRFLPMLKAMGAGAIVMQCPEELDAIVHQHVPTTRDLIECDYVCSTLMLMQVLQEFPGDDRGPYIKTDPKLVEKWRATLRPDHKHIGIAWDVGKAQDGDFPRACPLELFDKHLGNNETDLCPVQQVQGAFADFADCAALMSLMDEIVTVDTAAAHLAGAIGHRNVTLLLSRWHSWRWLMPLYPNMRICIQPTDGDWDGCFAQRHALL